jgi:hypothetical protein
MIFNKTQNVFASDWHREVWWWAVGIVPPSDSLTAAVKEKCSKDILDGCEQWHGYFNELCEDMYTHKEIYAPASARQYRDILENIAANGRIQGDDMIWDSNDWQKYRDKINKSKAYASLNITLERCLEVLERTGLNCEYTSDSAVFSNSKYAKIFHAMSVFEQSPNIRKTPARHHFAHCEFRQLFKSYSANYDELLRRVSDESLDIAHTIHAFAKSLKIERYVHFDTIKYKHKSIRVMDFTVTGNEYPSLRVNIGTCAKHDGDILKDKFYRHILDADKNIQALFIKNLERCDNAEHIHANIKINGKNEQVCPASRIRINPFKSDIDAVLYFINARKASIDQFF